MIGSRASGRMNHVFSLPQFGLGKFHIGGLKITFVRRGIPVEPLIVAPGAAFVPAQRPGSRRDCNINFLVALVIIIAFLV
jgi:hypothetical protein